MQKLNLFLPGVISTLLAITFFSCSKENKTGDVINQMEESLENSSKVISLSTDATMRVLFEKTTEWASMERAKIWFTKAEQVVKLSNEMYKYLDTAKKQLKEKRFLTDLLYKNLGNYQKNILDIDSSIKVEFSSNFNFVTIISKVTIPSALTALQNNIKVVENKIINYCNMKCGSIIDAFDTYSAIIGQNSTYLKTGDVLEIRAGIGAFSKSVLPFIKINGKNAEIEEEGFALYQMKVTNKSGQYKIPVEISFLNLNTGKYEARMVDVEYTIAKECDQ